MIVTPVACWRALLAAVVLTSMIAGTRPALSTPKPTRPQGPRVAILSVASPAHAWPAAERQLADELRTLGVTVVRVSGVPRAVDDPSVVLARLARTAQAFAAVRILRSGTPAGKHEPGHPVVIAWHERLTGKTSIRRGRVARLDRGTAALVALQAVELLRASLLELRARRRARARPAPTLPPRLLPRPSVVRRGPDRWALRLAGSLLYLPGGLAPRGGVLLGLRVWAHPWISLELQSDVTPFGADVTEFDRRTSVRYYGASVAALVELQGRRGWRCGRGWRVQPSLGVSAGARLVHIQGWDSFDLTGTSNLRVQADLAGVAQLAVRLGGPVRLRASLQGGVLLPPVGIRYVTGRQATLGAGYLAAQLGLELAW